MLTTRTVFITGGSSGIGLASACLFARRGWRVGLIARGQEGLASAASMISGLGAVVATAGADVADGKALRLAADSLVAALGVPDVWINCAGNGVYGRFTDVPADEYDRVTAVTYGGTVNGCRVALSLMRPAGQGTVVNVCSAIAFHRMPMMTSYAGAKGAVRCFAQALRAELAIERIRIRVSTIFPPAVNTPFFSHALSHMDWPARPAPPVYQPEVVAAGVYLAASTGRPEVVVSGTAAVFNLATRLSPGLIGFCMQRLGFEGQLTRDPEAAKRQRPTVFEPAAEQATIHGPFGARARGISIQLWFSQRRAALAPAAARFSRRRVPR